MVGEDMIDVVIPTYITNNKQLAMTLKCIDLAKNKTKLKFNTVIVETCSSYLQEYADVYIYEKERTTADISINRAFSSCRGKYVVLLTNDSFVSDNWLESLLECFDKREDCGAATLASTQFGHAKQDVIAEGIWCSVFMTYRKFANFDENYVNSWEDSDMLMNIYSSGLKMYRNFNSIVEHTPGQTVYQDKLTQENYEKNRAYFTNKWKDSNLHIYKVLTEGIIL